MDRRSFLKGILAAAAAPAIVRASSLMRVAPLIVPDPNLTMLDIALDGPLLRGELGELNGIRFIATGSDMAKRLWSEALFKQTKGNRLLTALHPSFFHDLRGEK